MLFLYLFFTTWLLLLFALQSLLQLSVPKKNSLPSTLFQILVGSCAILCEALSCLHGVSLSSSVHPWVVECPEYLRGLSVFLPSPGFFPQLSINSGSLPCAWGASTYFMGLSLLVLLLLSHPLEYWSYTLGENLWEPADGWVLTVCHKVLFGILGCHFSSHVVFRVWLLSLQLKVDSLSSSIFPRHLSTFISVFCSVKVLTL